MPIITIARKVFKLDRQGLTRKEAVFADSVWMMAAALTWAVYMFYIV